jgi:hypothetical protein
MSRLGYTLSLVLSCLSCLAMEVPGKCRLVCVLPGRRLVSHILTLCCTPAASLCAFCYKYSSDDHGSSWLPRTVQRTARELGFALLSSCHDQALTILRHEPHPEL